MKTSVGRMVRKALVMPFALVLLFSCSKDDKSINLFTVDQDIELGQQMKQEIASKPDEYPLLDRTQYSAAYQHIERIRDNILASGKLKYKDRFAWEVYIIKNDSVLNAFACPGGYMYFYTGIIKFLDNEAQLAGVMAHEMAHADRRHSTDQLTKVYGIQILLGILLGNNPTQLEQLVAGLASGLSTLAFSRQHEYEADEYAVKYLYATDYHAPALGDFFIKMGNAPRPPAFLSTHPDPGNRVDAINKVWQSLGGKSGELFPSRYQDFKNTLP